MDLVFQCSVYLVDFSAKYGSIAGRKGLAVTYSLEYDDNKGANFAAYCFHRKCGE